MKSIIILDFGSLFTQKIKHAFDRWFITSYIVPHNISLEKIMEIKPYGIVFSGGPDMLSENLRYGRENTEDLKAEPISGVPARRPHPGIYNLEIPILGICYGHQLIAEHFGVKIEKSPQPEYTKDEGMYTFYVLEDSPLFEGLPREFPVYMAHGDWVPRLPDGFTLLGKTDNTPIAAFQKGHIFGVQFHPEADESGISLQVLKNFADYAFQVKNYDE